MASLVDKIKHKVRSRSGSQSSESSPVSHRAGTRTPERYSTTANTTSSPSHNEAFPRASLENSAFHVSRGSNARQSSDLPPSRKPLPQTNGLDSQHRRQASLGGQSSDGRDGFPERGSSRLPLQETQGYGHRRGQSTEEERAVTEDLIPERGSSKYADTATSHGTPAVPPVPAVPAEYQSHSHSQSKDARAGRSFDIPERRAHNGTAAEELSKPLPDAPHDSKRGLRPSANTAGTSTPGSMSNNNWMSPLISTGQTQRALEPNAKRQADDAKYEAMASGHLRLPEGFNLQDTEDTHVYEEQRPAVTHETIIKQRTEIVREAITRDIHVHHYYTYVQPIKVVEVLPTKHYRLDPASGRKIEIPAPEGWTMPTNLNPVTQNTAAVTGWSRHYMVDERHPNGIPEDPPVGYDSDASDAFKEARTTQY